MIYVIILIESNKPILNQNIKKNFFFLLNQNLSHNIFDDIKKDCKKIKKKKKKKLPLTFLSLK